MLRKHKRKRKRAKKEALSDCEYLMNYLKNIEHDRCNQSSTIDESVKMKYPEFPYYPKHIKDEYEKEKEKWESILSSRVNSKNSIKK